MKFSINNYGYTLKNLLQNMQTIKSQSINYRKTILSVFVAFILAFTTIFCGWKPVLAADNSFPCLGSNPEKLGCWQKYPLPRDANGNILPFEAVHTSVLPDGKILIINGSSNRNSIDRQLDANGNDIKVTFIDGVKTSDQDVVSNNAIFDPEIGEFIVITSPPAWQNEDSNDLFCSGHLHLPNGDIIFIGGSNRYYPGEQFQGSKQSNIYHWETQTWTTVGKMQVGRWYPSLIPLADGKIVIFSGSKYDAPNQITPTIDIYDPKTEKFTNIDLRYIENSPFNVKIKSYQYYDENGQPKTASANIYDTIDLYPRVFPTADGKLLITGDGAGKFPLEIHKSNKTYLMSVKKDSAGKLSVSFEIGPDRKDISKVYGTAVPDPNREGDVLLIGGLLNNNNINFGKPQLGRFDDPTSPNGKLKAAGTRIVASLERWDSKNKQWSIVPNFLKEDDGTTQPRSMNQAVILPNKQILTVNGGIYAEYDQVYEPLLMTYDESVPGGYKTKEMNPATLPRLYHNGAVLLPDARVLITSGNASRAAREANGTIHVDVVPDQKDYYALAKLSKTPDVPDSFKVIPENEYNQFLEDYYKSPESYFVEGDSVPFVPAEIWQPEIFNPPYLFLPGDRPEIVTAPTTLKHGQASQITVKNINITRAAEQGSLVMVKLGTVTHSFDYGQSLADLAVQNVIKNNDGSYTFNFTAPANANLYTPGYYMMFYLNSIGKPSVAKMVQIQAS